jgi:hypothetical protein
MVHLTLLMLCILMLRAAYGEDGIHLTKQQWLEDLSWVTKTLEDSHPNLFYRLTKNDFGLVIAAAQSTIRDSRSDEECLAAIRQVVASIEDGHTLLGTQVGMFPLRLAVFHEAPALPRTTGACVTEYVIFQGVTSKKGA